MSNHWLVGAWGDAVPEGYRLSDCGKLACIRFRTRFDMGNLLSRPQEIIRDDLLTYFQFSGERALLYDKIIADDWAFRGEILVVEGLVVYVAVLGAIEWEQRCALSGEQWDALYPDGYPDDCEIEVDAHTDEELDKLLGAFLPEEPA